MGTLEEEGLGVVEKEVLVELAPGAFVEELPALFCLADALGVAGGR